MQNLKISTSRIEAFSDGVIAIIITVMVFDLKINEIPTQQTALTEIIKILPKFISYLVSFVVIAIMWVNHHQLFHQIEHTDRNLLWLNIHLLFWMSIIPFGTNFVGANPLIWQSTSLYGSIFFMSSFAFALLRNYVISRKLLHETISFEAQLKIKRKNYLALTLYFLSIFSGLISIYISFLLILTVPVMYFIPEKIIHNN